MPENDTTFTLSSNDLGGNFTEQHVANIMGSSGQNRSPHLTWDNPPPDAKSFAVTMHDPDAPTPSGFWHWAVFNIPGNVRELPAGAGDPLKELLPTGAIMGRADTGEASYCGPCPPEGDFIHRYIITVYALSTPTLDVDPETPLAQATFKIVTGPELARASLISYYKR